MALGPGDVDLVEGSKPKVVLGHYDSVYDSNIPVVTSHQDRSCGQAVPVNKPNEWGDSASDDDDVLGAATEE